MAISGVNDTYSKLISSITSNTTRVVDNTKDSSNDKSLIATLELNSSASDIASYLNYSANGNYSNLSLADFLNDDSNSEDNDLFSLLKTDTTSELSGNENSDISSDSTYKFDSDSISQAFKDLADAKTKEIDDLIEKTLSKMNKSSETK